MYLKSTKCQLLVNGLGLGLIPINCKSSFVSPGPASSGLTQHARATSADHNSLGAAEDGGDPAVSEYLVENPHFYFHSSIPEAAGTLDIHEVTVGMLN